MKRPASASIPGPARRMVRKGPRPGNPSSVLPCAPKHVAPTPASPKPAMLQQIAPVKQNTLPLTDLSQRIAKSMPKAQIGKMKCPHNQAAEVMSTDTTARNASIPPGLQNSEDLSASLSRANGLASTNIQSGQSSQVGVAPSSGQSSSRSSSTGSSSSSSSSCRSSPSRNPARELKQQRPLHHHVQKDAQRLKQQSVREQAARQEASSGLASREHLHAKSAPLLPLTGAVLPAQRLKKTSGAILPVQRLQKPQAGSSMTSTGSKHRCVQRERIEQRVTNRKDGSREAKLTKLRSRDTCSQDGKATERKSARREQRVQRLPDGRKVVTETITLKKVTITG